MASTFRTRWNLHVLLIILTIVIVSYTLLRMGVIELPAPKTTCPPSALLSSNPEENRHRIVNYPLVDSVPYLSRLGLHDVDNTPEFHGNPVLVTAASSNHFAQVKDFLDRMSSTLVPKLDIYVYDLGLTKEHRQQLCTGGECTLREFPFDEYPSFLKESVPSFAWKPVVIQLMLKEFGFVVWMDLEVYIPDGNIQGGIDIARREGIAAAHKKFLQTNNNIAYETDLETFRSLGEEPCAFERQYKYSGAILFIKRTLLTYKYIMRPWVSCALKKSCMIANAGYNFRCDNANRYGFCHRFDQSVLSIILNRLFYSNTNVIDIGESIQWVKCYLRDEVVVSNEMVFIYKENSPIKCPTRYA